MAKKVSRSLTFSEKKLTKYFPDDYTAKDMEQVIESLLENGCRNSPVKDRKAKKTKSKKFKKRTS